jgi:hypothetical protein
MVRVEGTSWPYGTYKANVGGTEEPGNVTCQRTHANTGFDNGTSQDMIADNTDNTGGNQDVNGTNCNVNTTDDVTNNTQSLVFDEHLLTDNPNSKANASDQEVNDAIGAIISTSQHPVNQEYISFNTTDQSGTGDKMSNDQEMDDDITSGSGSGYSGSGHDGYVSTSEQSVEEPGQMGSSIEERD